MRRRIAGLGIGLLGAAVLLTGCSKKLEETQQQLGVVSNELISARAETAEVKTQMQAKVEELQQNISKLTEEKADTEKQMQSDKTDLEQKLDAEQTKSKSLEQDKAKMEDEVKGLTDQLGQVNQKLTDLQNTHATTVTHLQAMREEYVKLTDEKTALEAKLHDLKALKEQIHVVKQELHDKKVEEVKRLDRAEYAMGNHGFLMKEGEWAVARTPGKYPFSGEMFREQ